MPLLPQVQRLSLYSSSADSCLMQHHVCSPCVTQDRDNLSSNHTGLNDTLRIAKSESGTVSVLGSLLVAVNKKTVFRELSCSRKTEVFSSAVPLSLLKSKAALPIGILTETNRSSVTGDTVTGLIVSFRPGCLEVSYTVPTVMPCTGRHLSELAINSFILFIASVIF